MREPINRRTQVVTGFLGGLRAFAGGITFIVGNPGMWGYALVPVFMLLLLGTCLGSLGVWGAWRMSAAISGDPASFFGHLGSWLLTIGLIVVAVVAAFLFACALAQPFSGFALDAIVRAQERALHSDHWAQSSFAAGLVRTLTVMLFTIAVGVTAMISLFLVSVFFPPALVVTLPLNLLLCAWTLSWNFLDYPWARRGMGVGARLRWVGGRFGAFSAFGLAWAGLLLLSGGCAILLLPMGVAGATLLVVEGEQKARE